MPTAPKTAILNKMRYSYPKRKRKAPMSNSPFYNKTELKQRGWTDTAITKFLGTPDKKGKNRKGRCGKVSLYYKDNVYKIESTARFKEWKLQSRARSRASLQAAEKKRQETLNKVSARLDSIDLNSEYKNLSRQDLRQRASKSFLEIEQRRQQRSNGKYVAEQITSRRTDAFFNRIETNYLRHEGTIYDDELREYFNATGVGQAIDMVREKIYETIAAYYPHLEEECEKQLGKRRSKEARKRGQDVTNRTSRIAKL